MNNPFQPRPTAVGGGRDQLAASSVGMVASTSNTPPQPKVPGISGISENSLADQKEAPAKKGWFSRLFGRGEKEDTVVKTANIPQAKTAGPVQIGSSVQTKPQAKPLPEVSAKTSPLVDRKSSEKDSAQKRHEDLLNSVNDICRSLEHSRAQKVEVSVIDLVPPLPVENIDALTRTQEAVTGVLDKVAGRLDKAGERDSLVIDSLKRVDGSLMTLSKVSERSISSMDGVKGTLGQVNGSMEKMQVELKRAGKRYEELLEKTQNSEKEHSESLVKLHHRTLLTNVFLGISLIGCVVAMIVVAAS